MSRGRYSQQKADYLRRQLQAAAEARNRLERRLAVAERDREALRSEVERLRGGLSPEIDTARRREDHVQELRLSDREAHRELLDSAVDLIVAGMIQGFEGDGDNSPAWSAEQWVELRSTLGPDRMARLLAASKGDPAPSRALRRNCADANFVKRDLGVPT